MMNFNPNDANAPQLPKWATYIPGRRPEFKLHKQKGHATNAVGNHKCGIVYEYVDNEWVERYRLDRKDIVCAIEGCDNRSKYHYYNSVYTLPGRRWVDGPPFYCSKHRREAEETEKRRKLLEHMQ